MGVPVTLFGRLPSVLLGSVWAASINSSTTHPANSYLCCWNVVKKTNEWTPWESEEEGAHLHTSEDSTSATSFINMPFFGGGAMNVNQWIKLQWIPSKFTEGRISTRMPPNTYNNRAFQLWHHHRPWTTPQSISWVGIISSPQRHIRPVVRPRTKIKVSELTAISISSVLSLAWMAVNPSNSPNWKKKTITRQNVWQWHVYRICKFYHGGCSLLTRFIRSTSQPWGSLKEIIMQSNYDIAHTHTHFLLWAVNKDLEGSVYIHMRTVLHMGHR